jgi:dTDP-glucose 4,6-dehydratase
MHNKNILVTGGAGFIGCHLVEYLLNKHQTVRIINLDLLTYAGDRERLKDHEKNPNYTFIHGDIGDADLVSQIFAEHKIDGVMHLAAESHVDNSISGPRVFFETNVMGTQNLLDNAKKYWLEENGRLKSEFTAAKFLHVSTDEVYGSLGNTGYFTEETPYAPNSPYSASKAASDFAARSYFHTYGLPIVISNCSNNFGPKQHDEKLIPTIIRNAIAGKEIPIYGNGKNIRDWLYVSDHCAALDRIFEKGKTGESYNIGTHNEKTNIEIATIICEILDEILPVASSYKEQITYVRDRAGHDFRYAIDNSKICQKLGWAPEGLFNQDLKTTIEWYVTKYTN